MCITATTYTCGAVEHTRDLSCNDNDCRVIRTTNTIPQPRFACRVLSPPPNVDGTNEHQLRRALGSIYTGVMDTMGDHAQSNARVELFNGLDLLSGVIEQLKREWNGSGSGSGMTVAAAKDEREVAVDGVFDVQGPLDTNREESTSSPSSKDEAPAQLLQTKPTSTITPPDTTSPSVATIPNPTSPTTTTSKSTARSSAAKKKRAQKKRKNKKAKIAADKEALEVAQETTRLAVRMAMNSIVQGCDGEGGGGGDGESGVVGAAGNAGGFVEGEEDGEDIEDDEEYDEDDGEDAY
jgi:hypothetical protein